jgi:hypothetical protein
MSSIHAPLRPGVEVLAIVIGTFLGGTYPRFPIRKLPLSDQLLTSPRGNREHFPPHDTCPHRDGSNGLGSTLSVETGFRARPHPRPSVLNRNGVDVLVRGVREDWTE